MSMSREVWNKNLEGFKTSTAKSVELARTCSIAALEHFAEHGDTVYLQEFLDAMVNNYNRKSAFLAWARDFSPLTMKDSKLVKDKSPDANQFDLTGAKKKDFWNYVADNTGSVFFTENDVVKSLERAIKRLAAKKPKDDAAKAELDKAVAAIEALKPVEEPAGVEDEEDQPDQPETATIETAEEAAAVLARVG